MGVSFLFQIWFCSPGDSNVHPPSLYTIEITSPTVETLLDKRPPFTIFLTGAKRENLFHIVKLAKAGSRMSDTTYKVQVIDRALSIINLLAMSGQPPTACEIGQKLDLNKSTAHRLLAILERHRYVERYLNSGKYRLGLKLAELGNIALSRFDLQGTARPFVERLVQQTGETAHMGILQGSEVVSLVNVETHQSVRTPSTIGRRSPIHCTSQGKLLLAFQEPSRIDEILRGYKFTPYTRKTIRLGTAYRAELARVRNLGFALDDEEFEEGLRCIGAPVRDHTGAVVAALSIAGPAFRVTSDRTPHLIRAVIGVGNDLSEALGHSKPAAIAATVTHGHAAHARRTTQLPRRGKRKLQAL